MAADMQAGTVQMHRGVAPASTSGSTTASRGSGGDKEWVINVRTLTGRALTVRMKVTTATTFGELKEELDAQENIPLDHQRLVFTGREPADTETLHELGMQNGDVVHLLLKKLEVPGAQAAPAQAGAGAYNGGGGYPPANEPYVVNIVAPELDYGDVDLNELTNLVRLSRAVKLFSIIDSLILVLFVFWDEPLLTLTIVMPLCGYYGAHKFKRSYVRVYLAYVPLYLLYRGYYTFASPEADSSTSVMFIIACMVEMYIFYVIVKLDQSLKARSELELEQLYELLHPGTPR